MTSSTNARDRPQRAAHGRRHRRRLRRAADRGHAGPLRPPRRPGRARSGQGWPRCAPAACRSSRSASTSWWPRAWRPATLRFTESAVEAVAGARVRLPVRADAPGRRRLGRPLLRRGGGQGDRGPPRAGRHRRQQVDGAGRLGHDGRAGASAAPTSASSPTPSSSGRAPRCLDSLNPDRIVVGADDPQAAAKVGRAVLGDPAHRCIVTDATTVGDDQVRLQRLPGHQAQLRQRGGRPVRGGRGRRPRRDARPRATTSGSASSSCAPARAGAGRCLPKDTRALLHIAEQAGYDFSLLRRRHRHPTTSSWPGWWTRSRPRAVARSTGATIAVWGLTFKANTDDRRDSPSLRDRPSAGRELGATVQAFDPTVGRRRDASRARRPARACMLRADPYEAATGARGRWSC